MESLAQLQSVHKQFGQINALSGLDLDVRPGEIVTLLGPNGAGKTTAISLLLGRRRPDQGQALLFGRDPRSPQIRSQLGATPQETQFPARLRVSEVMDLVRAHFAQPRTTDVLLELVGLLDQKERQIGGLSGGQQRRLAVALAFAGNPRLVFLDEPTTGLDVEARRRLWQTIQAYRAAGGTVLLTTHYLEEAEVLASRVLVINHGRIIAEGSVADITARVSLKRVRFRAAALPDDLPGVEQVEHEAGRFTLYTPDPDQVIQQLVQQGVEFENLEIVQTNLEEAFLALTAEEKDETGLGSSQS